MSLTILTFAGLLILSFFAMMLIYIPFVAKYSQTMQFKFRYTPFLYLYLLYAIGLIVAYFFHNNDDFLEPLTFARAFTPLLLAALVFSGTLVASAFARNVLIILCTAVAVFMQPLGIGTPFPSLPPIAIQLGLVVVFSVFCIYFRTLNILPQTAVVPSIFILLGISVMGFLSAVPAFLMLISATLLGGLCSYLAINLHTVKIELDNASCTALAFIIGNVILLDTGEYSFVSCLIFTIPFWVEFSVALWRKYITDKSGTLEENTNYKMAAEYLSMQALILNVAKICIFTLFLGFFQMFSVNSYSLLIVSFALILWFNNSMGQAISTRSSLKEINQEFVKNLKQNIEEAKSSIENLTNKEDK